MKRAIFLNCILLAAVLAVGGAGCHGKRLSRTVTPIPGQKAAVVPAETKPRPPLTTPTPTPPNQGTGPGPGATIKPEDVAQANPLKPDETGAIPTVDRDLIEGKYLMDTNAFQAQTLYFDFDRYAVKPSESSKVETVAAQLKEKPDHAVMIDGHCDERGTEEYNRALGERRALSVREYLVRLGVGAERIRTRSWGEDRPAETGHDEAAWAKNRRGEFILLTPKN